MTCFGPKEVATITAAAVALATLAPKDWHDIALDLARQKWGVGPGGSATEDEEENEESQ